MTASERFQEKWPLQFEDGVFPSGTAMINRLKEAGD
jgi:hypothetical protein